jgi:hypothetical protein
MGNTMILKKKIDIPKFNEIQTKLQQIFIDKFDNVQKEKIDFLNDDIVREKIPELSNFFDKNNLTPNCFAVLIRSPFVVAPIHVDGDGSQPVVLALNLPVFNCKDTSMNWYNIPSDQLKFIEDRGNRYKSMPIDYDWTQLTPIETLELTDPYMVRVNVPHNVVNNRDTFRAILSIRFSTTPTHLWPDSITDSFW